jgi:general secretion pathway protein C
MRLIFSERYLVALNFLLIAGSAYFAARSVNDLLTRWIFVVPLAPRIAPAPPLSPLLSRQDYALIVQRDIFNAVKAQPAIPPPPPEAAVDLHLKLVGTSHLTRTKPFAIIEDENSQIQALYQLGDQVPAAGELTAIEKAQVVINHDGQLITLTIPEESQTSNVVTPAFAPSRFRRHRAARRLALDPRYIRRIGPNDFVVYRRAIESDLQNLRPLLSQIRASPNLENGKTNGYSLSEVQPGSVFAEMGLRDGDIVSAVNGQDLNDPTQALLLLNNVRDQSSISVTVKRFGQPVQYNFSVR